MIDPAPIMPELTSLHGEFRHARGGRKSALARLVGYRNVQKGVRRILRLERDGHASDTLIANVAEALGIEFGTVLDLQERDRASSPYLPFALLRIISGGL